MKFTLFSHVLLFFIGLNLCEIFEHSGENQTIVGKLIESDVENELLSHDPVENQTIPFEKKNDTNFNGSISKNLSNEEIPLFSEWTQKRLEEAKKQQNLTHVRNFTGIKSDKTRQKSANRMKSSLKNYASPNCGSKVVDFNTESGNPNHIITPIKDEYCLNKCEDKIWFVIELCEPIQVKIFELANFELFSSSPNQFQISVSDHYKPKEWSLIGQFNAADHHDLQKFHINSHIFGKFVKFDILSHYGSEHYCPISLIKIFGTSELELLKKEDDVVFLDDFDDDDTNNETNDNKDPHKVTMNIFGTAKEAVNSMVAKVKQVLGVNGITANNQTLLDQSTLLLRICSTPRFEINVDPIYFDQVFHLISCQTPQLFNLLKNAFIVTNLDECLQKIPSLKHTVLNAFFTDSNILALCHCYSIVNNTAILNTTSTALGQYGQNVSKIIPSNSIDDVITLPNGTCESKNDTLRPLDVFLKNFDNFTSLMILKNGSENDDRPACPINVTKIDTDSVIFNNTNGSNSGSLNLLKTETLVPQQESVFLRLSNRIKTLELNLSVYSQYLEELSQRYKKQVEDMQRHFDEIVTGFQDEIEKRDKEIQNIREKLESNFENSTKISNYFNSWKYTIIFYAKLIISEVIVAFIIIYIYRCHRQDTVLPDHVILKEGSKINHKRSNSADTVSGNTNKKYERRFSHEPSLMTSTLPNDVVAAHNNNNKRTLSKAAEKRQRRKLKRSTSHQLNLNLNTNDNRYGHRRVSSDRMTNLENIKPPNFRIPIVSEQPLLPQTQLEPSPTSTSSSPTPSEPKSQLKSQFSKFKHKKMTKFFQRIF